MNIQIVQRRGHNVRQNDEDNFDDDVDPDLHNEIEIHFTARESNSRGIISSSKSRQTMSGKSSARKSEAENSVPSRIVRSRGRPMKPHETEPFLSIDNLPADKYFVSEKTAVSPLYRTVQTPRSPANPRTAVVVSPYATPRPVSATAESKLLKKTLGFDLRTCRSAGTKSRSGMGSRSGSRPGSCQVSRPGSRSQVSRQGRLTPTNSLLYSPSKQLSQPNHHVKSPFKHAVLKPQVALEDRPTSPSQDLKDRTAQAQRYLSRLMAMSPEKEPRKTPGKLKKGKLKPLYPVNVEGPKIERCRGIVSDTRTYHASPSRTLQRRMHLLNTIPNVHEYLKDHRPCTTESVHQTSVASTDEEVANMEEVLDVGDENMDSNRSIPDEEPVDLELGLDEEGVNKLPNALNEYVNDIKGPDFESRASSINESPTLRMFATEVGIPSPHAISSDLTVPPHLQQFSIENSEDPQLLTDSQSKEPVVNESRNTEANDEDRKIGSTSPPKSVRFAEEKARRDSFQSSKDLKQQTNIAKQQKERKGSADVKKKKKKPDDNDEMERNSEDSVKKKNKQNTKSCKTDSINEIYKKDDDDDKNNNKKRYTPNQSNPQSTTSGKSESNTQDKSCESKSEGGQSSEGQGQKRTRNTQPRSQSPLRGQNCSKFYQSSASKPHVNTLQVQTIIHASSAQNIMGPESPSRSQSHYHSPSSCHGEKIKYSSLSKYDFPNAVDSAKDEFDYFQQKSKVKFMIEGEEPQIETIFIEDENNIALRPDQDLSFEAIECELESLRHVIQNKLTATQTEELNLDSENSDIENTDSKSLDADKALIIEGRNPYFSESKVSVDSVQTDYDELIENYRRKCMDRSEFCGAFSGWLVTPRKYDNYAYSNNLPITSTDSHQDDSSHQKYKLVESSSVTHVSDSGLGSIDNISEISKSTSQTKFEIPRLNLDSCTSDLDLDSEANSSTREKDEGDCGITVEDDFGDNKTILEMICDDLPAAETKKLKKNDRKQAEEDMSKLKVEASAKCLSKPPQQKLTMTRSSNIPFPPLCFTINARPPSGYLYYFAYGPDMNPSRFSSYIKREIDDRFWALLFGFNLVFNKRGISLEAGGFANLEFNPLRSVEGCMYKITPEELEVLDKCIGYPEHFEHLVLPVWFSNSKDPENYGVCQYCVPALTYIAQNKWTETETKLPCDYSLSQCIKSADMCTQEYRNSLVSMTRQIASA